MFIATNRSKSKIMLGLAGTMFAAAALAGCSGGSPAPAAPGAGSKPQASTPSAPADSKPAANAPAKDEKPFVITMMNLSVLSEPPKDNDPIITAVEKLTNTDLQIQWVPNGTYDEKVNATIASGQLPMVFLVGTPLPSNIKNAMKAGQFWEIGPYLKEFPNLEKALNPQVLKSTAVGGKYYTINRARSLVGDGMIYRTDWLNKLGMKPPTTLDEMYQVIKAFATKDPDGNGKNDTLGLAEEKGLRGFKLILAATGGGNVWEVKNDQIVPAHESKAFTDAMDWYRRLYQEKLINQDFAITERVQNIDNGNKGLFGFRLGDNDFITRHSELFKLTPSAELDTSSILKGVNGTKLLMDNGVSGSFVIPKQTVKTEADLKKILQYFDKLSTKEGQNIFEWGIEGVHYTIKDGKADRTPEQAAKYAAEVIQMQQAMQVADGSLAMEGILDKYTSKYKVAKKEAAAVADIFVINPAAAYSSPTFDQKRTQLDKIISDARVKYIMGELDDKGWKAALDSWRKSGGDKVLEELNQEYKADPNKGK
ncbi:extracellular solute-binding protein [Paenibacillus thalictri]|uniref:Extracellular solute-binding protein n=1 Tax=Paenibacillus thalictri TaxID=2527873 RepID=A0A4Q9DE03_9BACL|nr:extracellular solute-binding protein [Paenibacillus thalictri]TBL69694.1 extracellular solute-binding protein [Paenibacillus thalictri]